MRGGYQNPLKPMKRQTNDYLHDRWLSFLGIIPHRLQHIREPDFAPDRVLLETLYEPALQFVRHTAPERHSCLHFR